MTEEGTPTPDTPKPTVPLPEPAVRVVFADPAETGRRRRRVVGCITLFVTIAWSTAAYLVYKEVGTLVFVNSLDAYVGELAATTRPAARTSSPAATPGPALPADPLSMFFNPFGTMRPSAASPPTSGPATARANNAVRKPAIVSAGKPANVKAAEVAVTVGAWAETIRAVWLGMMAVVALIMLTAALLGVAGSPRSVGAHHFAAWVIITATLGTFLAISLLIDKANFPPMPTTTYVLITLLHSGYGWILLLFDPLYMHATHPTAATTSGDPPR